MAEGKSFLCLCLSVQEDIYGDPAKYHVIIFGGGKKRCFVDKCKPRYRQLEDIFSSVLNVK